MQIFLCNVKYCDFCIWSKNKMLILRVFPCDQFWAENAEKANHFARLVLLPEILRNVYTKTRRTN